MQFFMGLKIFTFDFFFLNFTLDLTPFPTTLVVIGLMEVEMSTLSSCHMNILEKYLTASIHHTEQFCKIRALFPQYLKKIPKTFLLKSDKNIFQLVLKSLLTFGHGGNDELK